MEPFYPLRALVCDALLPGPARGVRVARATSSRDYAYFSSYSTSWLEHARALRRGDDRALRASTARATSSRSPPTTATCCSTSSERGVPVLGIEPAANVAEVAVAKGHPDAGRVLRRARPRAALAERVAGRPAARQQRARARARPQRLRRRHEDPAQAGRRDHDGVPAPDAADRREPVRHDLPRALLLPLVHDRAPGVRRARAAAVRRRGAADPRRLAAHLRLPRRRRGQADDRARAGAARARGRPRATRSSRTYLDFGARVAEDKREILEFADRAQARGQADRRLRRAGQGQHAAQLLRHRHATSSTTRSTSTRTSRATCCPARTSRSARPRRSARTGPTSCFILPWNLKDEIVEQLAFIREWGGTFAVRTPELTLLP